MRTTVDGTLRHCETCVCVVKPNERTAITEALLKMTAEEYGITVEDLTGFSRTEENVVPRHEGMYRMRMMGFLLKEIGAAFGYRDHSTVINGIRKARNRRASKVSMLKWRSA